MLKSRLTLINPPKAHGLAITGRVNKTSQLFQTISRRERCGVVERGRESKALPAPGAADEQSLRSGFFEVRSSHIIGAYTVKSGGYPIPRFHLFSTSTFCPSPFVPKFSSPELFVPKLFVPAKLFGSLKFFDLEVLYVTCITPCVYTKIAGDAAKWEI